MSIRTAAADRPLVLILEDLHEAGPLLFTTARIRRPPALDIFLTEKCLSAVQEGTGGNPFFLDELVRRFMTERRFRDAPGGGLEVPEGLKSPLRT